MKKVDFLELVCAELARMGIEDAEIRIQYQNTDRYLTSMGIGEESPALDREDPGAFAKLICSNIARKQRAQTAPTPSIAEEKSAVSEPIENDFSEEMPNVESFEEPAATQEAPKETIEEAVLEDVDDVKVFTGSREPQVLAQEPVFEEIEPEPVYEEIFQYSDQQQDTPDETYNPFEEVEEYVVAPENVNGTIEFDVASIKKKTPPKADPLEEEEDYFEKSDEEDYKPSGNPALFWVLVCLTSFLWIPLGVLLFVGIGLGVVLMLVFEALYIPAIVGIIVSGFALSFAELIYSIIKFAGKNPAVALFELGLGFLVAALSVGLPAGMYYLGVGVFPKWIKNYGRNVKKLLKKLRRLYRRLKGACSI